MTSRPTETQHLRDLARLRRVRDRIDREYAQPRDAVHEEIVARLRKLAAFAARAR